jgi:hypothetical protein
MMLAQRDCPLPCPINTPNVHRESPWQVFLHLAPGAVDILVEMTRVAVGGGERGDDEARVCLALGPLGLGDDAALSAPALARRPGEVLEAAGGLVGLLALRLRRGEFGRNRLDEAPVLRQPEEVIDAVRLAPRHESLAREAAIGAQHNTHVRPAPADLRHDPRDLLLGTGRAVDVRAPQLRRQQVTTAEDVERQIAVAIVVAVEEPPFLMPVQRIVRSVEIEDDLLGRRLVGLQKQLDKQTLDGDRIMVDLVIPRRQRLAQLETVQRRLAGNSCAILAPGCQLTCQHRHDRIVA